MGDEDMADTLEAQGPEAAADEADETEEANEPLEVVEEDLELPFGRQARSSTDQLEPRRCQAEPN